MTTSIGAARDLLTMLFQLKESEHSRWFVCELGGEFTPVREPLQLQVLFYQLTRSYRSEAVSHLYRLWRNVHGLRLPPGRSL